MSQEFNYNSKKSPPDMVAVLEQARKDELQTKQSVGKKRQLWQTIFTFSLVAFLLCLIVWAIGIGGLTVGLEKFALGIGSIILGVLFLLSAAALYILIQLPKPKGNISDATTKYIQDYIPYFLSECYEKIAIQLENNHSEAFTQQLKTCRLLKIQESIAQIAQQTLVFDKKYYSATVSDLRISKQISNNPPKTTIRGIFIAIQLPQVVQNNAAFFSIKNAQQHFESLSFNDFILGDNEVRRLVKQHDHKVPHNLVDEFNKHLLMLSRNPAWLVNQINESAANILLELDKTYQHNIRIEINTNHLYAFLPLPQFLSPPPLTDTWDSQNLQQHTQTQIDQISELIDQLQDLITAIYEED
jgi:hypothetical protein